MKLLLPFLASALVLLTEAQSNAQVTANAVFNTVWSNEYDSCTSCKATDAHTDLKKYVCQALTAAITTEDTAGFISPIGCNPTFSRVANDVTKTQVNYVLELKSMVATTLTVANFNAQTTTTALTATTAIVGTTPAVTYTGTVTTAGQLNNVKFSRVLGSDFTVKDLKFLRTNPNYGNKICSVARLVGTAPKNATLEKLYEKCLGQKCYMKDVSLTSLTVITTSTGTGFTRRDSDIIHCMCEDQAFSAQYPFGLRTDTDSEGRKTCAPKQVGTVENRATHRCPAGCLGTTCDYILQFEPTFNECKCTSAMLRRNNRYCATKCDAGHELVRTKSAGETEALFKTCQKCPKGTYNTVNTSFLDRCKVCPVHTTTKNEGSTAVTQCSVAIAPVVIGTTVKTEAPTTTAAPTTAAPTTAAPTTAAPTTAAPTTAAPTTAAPTTQESTAGARSTRRPIIDPPTRRPVMPNFSPSLVYSGFAMLAGLGLF